MLDIIGDLYQRQSVHDVNYWREQLCSSAGIAGPSDEIHLNVKAYDIFVWPGNGL